MRIHTLSVIVLALLLFPLNVMAFGIGLTPSTVELEIRPGSHHRQVLRLKNFNKEKPIKLTASVADWTLDENGKVKLLPPDETDRSSSTWVNFSPSNLLVQPDTTQTIVVDINAPLSLNRSGDHRTAIILSTTLPSRKDRQGKQGVWNRYQIASLFYVNIVPGKSKPSLTSASFSSGSEARRNQTVDFRIENKGDRHIRMNGSVSLRNSDNEVINEEKFQGVLLDNYSRDFNVSFGSLDLEPGDYHVAFDIKGDGKAIPVNLTEPPILRIQ